MVQRKKERCILLIILSTVPKGTHLLPSTKLLQNTTLLALLDTHSWFLVPVLISLQCCQGLVKLLVWRAWQTWHAKAGRHRFHCFSVVRGGGCQTSLPPPIRLHLFSVFPCPSNVHGSVLQLSDGKCLCLNRINAFDFVGGGQKWFFSRHSIVARERIGRKLDDELPVQASATDDPLNFLKTLDGFQSRQKRFVEQCVDLDEGSVVGIFGPFPSPFTANWCKFDPSTKGHCCWWWREKNRAKNVAKCGLNFCPLCPRFICEIVRNDFII